MLIPLDDAAAELRPDVGVVGGSGFYEFLDDAVDVVPHTPYGPPSAPVRVGTVEGRRVAFLARHGRDHEFAAHRVPYQANVWAMASLGVRSIIAPCSVGSLQPHLHPGEFVVVDQLVDRTARRPDTFHDVGSGDDAPGSDGPVHHQPFAEPYDATLRRGLLAAATDAGEPVVAGAVYATTQGPRLETAAEIDKIERDGGDIVGMTGMPEAGLARELGLSYAAVAGVVNYAAGRGASAAGVRLEDINAVSQAAMARVRKVLDSLLILDAD